MNTTRRRFLQTVAGAASLGLSDLPLLGKTQLKYVKFRAIGETCRQSDRKSFQHQV